MTKDNDGPVHYGWWVFYASVRTSDQLVFLFNIKARSQRAAINKGLEFYDALPAQSPVRRLYSVDGCTARPLSQEQAELLDSMEHGQ